MSAKNTIGTTLDALGADLDDCGLHPDIASLLLLAVETDKAPPVDVGRESSVNVTGILATQSKIGWGLVKYRFLSTMWKVTQNEWAS